MLGTEGGDGGEVTPAECKEHVEEDHRDIDEDDQGEKRFCRGVDVEGEANIKFIKPEMTG